MDEEMRDLIEESIHLQQELGLLTPIMLFLNPSWNSGETVIEKVSTKGRLRFRRCEKIGLVNHCISVKAQDTEVMREGDFKKPSSQPQPHIRIRSPILGHPGPILTFQSDRSPLSHAKRGLQDKRIHC